MLITKILCAGLLILSIRGSCFAAVLLEAENFSLSLDTYFRQDAITLKNTVDLDSSNSDDTATYFGIDYNLGFKTEFKNSAREFYLKLERNGPSDYSAPLFIHNALVTSGGAIARYRNEELLPQVEEFWFDGPLFNNIGFKIGLYTYEAGGGFSLNGAFENYGFTIYKENKDFSWRLYYCRPDLVYKNRLGPRIIQEKDQDFVYEPNSANFLAADVKFKAAQYCLNPYIGVLADYTSSGKRDNAFAAPTSEDILGTFGASWNYNRNNLSCALELAHNFGRAESESPDFKDVYHTGYLAYTQIDYRIKNIIPRAQLLVCSGNKVKPEAAKDQDTASTSGKNRAFSYLSPLNNNLDDSISGINAASRPIVAMASGYGLNYGVPRPGTFSSSDFDDLIMPSIGLDWELSKQLVFSLDAYYIRSFARPVGRRNAEGVYLSKELGHEADLIIDYRFNEKVLLSFLGGYFLPGRFYKERRDDTAGSLFSPFVRGDGKADPAYQVELAMEFVF